MNQSEWLWVGLLMLIAAVAGVALYLYLDYRASRDRAKAARLQQRPNHSRLLSGSSLSRRKVAKQPRIVFGETHSPGNQNNPGASSVQPATGVRTCPVCRRPINGDDYLADRVIICPHCRTHVHAQCWEYSSNRCPVCGQ